MNCRRGNTLSEIFRRFEDPGLIPQAGVNKLLERECSAFHDQGLNLPFCQIVNEFLKELFLSDPNEGPVYLFFMTKNIITECLLRTVKNMQLFAELQKPVDDYTYRITASPITHVQLGI